MCACRSLRENWQIRNTLPELRTYEQSILKPHLHLRCLVIASMTKAINSCLHSLVQIWGPRFGILAVILSGWFQQTVTAQETNEYTFLTLAGQAQSRGTNDGSWNIARFNFPWG